jgi:hypothetical protein
MPRTLSDDDVRRLRMRAQCLAGSRPTTVVGVLSQVSALQAQDTRAARLGIRARSSGLDAAAVIRACNDERSAVRTWAMRGTLHMLPAEDVGWLVALLGPSLAQGDRRRRLELGLDDDLCTRALPVIQEILAGGQALSRADLASALAARGIIIDAKSQAPAHLVALAATRGLICRGPDREDDEPTYVLLEEWLGKQPERDPEGARAALARLYLRGHGPASAQDFAWWSGLPLGTARRGIEALAGELEAVEVAGEQAWMLADVGPGGTDDAPCVRLLPAFDAYLLGFRSRDFALAPQFARRINAGGGMIAPTLLVDGRIAGTWRQARRGSHLTITVRPFASLYPSLLPALEAEAADVGHFLGLGAALAVEGDPSPGA